MTSTFSSPLVLEADLQAKTPPQFGSATGGEAMHRKRVRMSHAETTAVPDDAVPVKVLVETIERELIPRLVLAHREEGLPVAADTRTLPTRDEITCLAAAAIKQDLPTALALARAMIVDGLSLESVLVHYLTPAARLLGEYWDTDLHTYTEVTGAMTTLQGVVQSLGPSLKRESFDRGLVLLSSAPGEQHTLGLFLLSEFLFQAGWAVDLAPGLSHPEIIEMVSHTHVDMVGLTVSNPKLLGPLGRLTAGIKKNSLNREVLIVVGGSTDLVEFAQAHEITAICDPQTAVHWLDAHVTAPRKALSLLS
jgi:methanogenic corrinoid protein MtbC1